MSNKVKVPGGAFYAGDGLTVDPVTRTVSASGGGEDSGVTTLHIYISAVNGETPTFIADKTPEEMLYTVTPTWCIVTFAAGVIKENEVSVAIPPAFSGGLEPRFGYVYHKNENPYVVRGNISENKWIINLLHFGQ